MSAVTVVPMAPAIQLKRILYATDFSDGSRAALGVVSGLARHYHSEALVAHICAPLPYIMVTPEVVSVAEKQREGKARSKLADLLRVTDALRVGAKPIVRIGEPVEELSRMVREHNIDLVVLSTHGRIGLKHLMMGSVAEALFRHLSCPVLTIGPHLAHRFFGLAGIHNILFPTDLSEESQAVFPYLASLADEHHARIILLHVLPAETSSNPDARRLAEPLRRQMMHIFGPQIGSRSAPEFVIDAGDASERILAHACEQNVDLIGFGISRTAEFTTRFRNTVAYRVLLNARCPVLTKCFHRPW